MEKGFVLWHPSGARAAELGGARAAREPRRGRPPRAADLVRRHVPQSLHPLRGSGHARPGDPGADRLRALPRRRRARLRPGEPRRRGADGLPRPPVAGDRRRGGRTFLRDRPDGAREPEDGLVWARHCGEEIGNWGVFLPRLYDLYRAVTRADLNPFADLVVVRDDGVVRTGSRRERDRGAGDRGPAPRLDGRSGPDLRSSAATCSARSAFSPSATGRSGPPTPAAASCGSTGRLAGAGRPAGRHAVRGGRVGGAVHDRGHTPERARVRPRTATS